MRWNSLEVKSVLLSLTVQTDVEDLCMRPRPLRGQLFLQRLQSLYRKPQATLSMHQTQPGTCGQGVTVKNNYQKLYKLHYQLSLLDCFTANKYSAPQDIPQVDRVVST